MTLTIPERLQSKMVEIKTIVSSEEGLRDHPLLLRGASDKDIAEILGPKKDIQTAKTSEEKSIIFAQALWEKGMIGKDLTYWRKLGELYRENERPLPENFAVRLALEAFVRTRIEVERNNKFELLDEFWKIGRQIYKKEGFEYKAEQEFIVGKIKKENKGLGSPASAAVATMLERERFEIYGEEMPKGMA